MPIGDEDYSNNLPALGRFKPGSVGSGEDTGALDVTLSTNLAGEPIRFTLNESLDNIVSTGTLTMLNATIGDEGEQQVGVMGEVKTEEDEAKWGTLYDSAPIEPNQLATVTESGGGLGTCTTYWRVVGVTSYLDENDVPYYEVQLEGYGQIAIDTKFDPSKIVTEPSMAWFYLKDYYDSLVEKSQADLDNDGYISEEEVTDATEQEPALATIFAGARYIVDEPTDYLTPFLNQLNEAGLECGAGGTPGISVVPLESKIQKGESCWQVIEDILGLNGYMARFKRDKKMVMIDITGTEGWSAMPTAKADDGTPIYDQEDIDNPPLQDTDIGDFGRGLQLSYSKEGVFSQAVVSGMVGKVGEDGLWVVDGEDPKEVIVTSSAGLNILNGQVVELAVQVEERYHLQSTDELTKFGQKELYKSVIGARSATYDSESVPLAVEVGMSMTGSSKLGGATNIFITALNRTTDAQQNKITTGLSGTRITGGAGGEENTMGWE